jgi:endonuclease/exonuclease/phosphatase family metal-dependent hydrolase
MKRLILVLTLAVSVLAGTAQKKQNALRVMSYNIHHANPPSRPGLIDLDTIAGVINKLKPDLVALQEVDVNTGRSGGKDQAKILAEKTGMQVYFAKAIDHDGGDYGVAILSRLPISDFKTYALPRVQGSHAEPRVLAMVKVQVANNKSIFFACTHLDAERPDSNRIVQAKEIARILQGQDLPVILAGDINAEAGTAVVDILDRAFLRSCLIDCGFTIPVEKPSKTIDFIFYSRNSSFSVKEHKVINERYASDHLPVFAVLYF